MNLSKLTLVVRFLDVAWASKRSGHGWCTFGSQFLDMRDGLATKMTIQKGPHTHMQQLDYLGVPFRCVRCHCYDHVVMDCDAPFQRNIWVRKANQSVVPLELKIREAQQVNESKLKGSEVLVYACDNSKELNDTTVEDALNIVEPRNNLPWIFPWESFSSKAELGKFLKYNVPLSPNLNNIIDSGIAEDFLQ